MYIYIYIYIIIIIIIKNKKTQQPQHQCAKFKTYSHLKFMSTIYPHGYITRRPWRYNTE